MHRWMCRLANLALLCSLPAGAAAAGQPRPNILFIMVDEMRWDAMSCAGHPIVKTPNLDRLAREGTRFATAYTCSAVCSPSRYSFFTSRYAHVHGAMTNGVPTREPQLLLPTILKHYGYETAISGKLHFTPAQDDYDFDYFWSFNREGPGKLQRWPEYLSEKLGPKAALVVPGSRPYPNDPLGGDIAKLPYPKEDYQTFWITDRAIDFLHRRNPQKPFFLFVSYLDPHSPSHLPEPYWSMAAAMKVPAPKIPAEVKHQRAEALEKPGGARGSARHLVADEAMAQALTANYYATIRMVDDNIGRLLDQLERMGLAENTIIVFTADHGNMLGDRGRWFKGLAYEGSARIPLLIKAPAAGPLAASFNAGKVVPQIVENIDVMPTLLEMSSLALPEQGLQGRSLVRLVAGTDHAWKDCAFSELGYLMIRTPQYKLIKNGDKRMQAGGDTWELYDLLKDPREEHNLAADPAFAKVVEELSLRLDAWQKDVPPVPVIQGLKVPEHAASSSGEGASRPDRRAAKQRGARRRTDRAAGRRESSN
jgi:arylsulfatase A-like enzyme